MTNVPKVKVDIWHDLPPVMPGRWIASRKALLLRAILEECRPDITREAVCARYDISPEELDGWFNNFKKHQMNGLKVTRIQKNRG